MRLKNASRRAPPSLLATVRIAMLSGAPRLQPCLQRTVSPPQQFLRFFTSSASSQSKIGRALISIPPSVKLTHIPAPASNKAGLREPPSTLLVEGPLGSLSLSIPSYVIFNHDLETKKVSLTVQSPDARRQREQWGTVRALLQNHVTGVSEGHIAILRLVGVGYKATIENGGKIVNLKVQYAHPVELPVPEGVKATAPQPTRILLEGADKRVVKQFAANIREWREPEPYKGKGIFIDEEAIKLKNRKIK